jgi:CHAD domain-containing protein
MAYRIRRREPLRKGVKRIVRRQVARATELGRDEARPLDARVHDLRSCLKRARAVVRLVREDTGKRARRDQRFLRDVGRGLARARELTVEPQTLRRLRELHGEDMSPSLRAALQAAERRAERRATSTAVTAPLDAALAELRQHRKRVGRWDVHRARRSVRRGVEAAYRRARRAFTALGDHRDADSFHEWRKSIKFLGHQLRLLRRAAPELWRTLGQPLDELGDWLGEARDLSLLRAQLTGGSRALRNPADRDQLAALIDRTVAELHERARARGAALLVASPREIGVRLKDALATWRKGPRHRRPAVDLDVDVEAEAEAHAHDRPHGAHEPPSPPTDGPRLGYS